MQEAAQGLASVVLGLPGDASIRYPIEAMVRPRVQVELDSYTGAAQPIRIDHVFFEKEIKPADRDVGWRQPRHIRGASRRRIRRDIGRARLYAEQRPPAEIVVRLRPDELADVGMKVFAHRRAVVDHRIDQMLKREFGSLPVARVECGTRCKTAAAAFAFDTDAGRIKPEPTCIRMQPNEDRIDVLDRRRVRRLRGEAMIHGIDCAAQLRREDPVFHILHFRRAHHEAAAMDVYDDGQRIVGGEWTIRENADRLGAKRALDMDFFDGDIRQAGFGDDGGQLQRLGAATHQRFPGQRQQRLLQRIAQFGIDKFDCAHGWKPGPM